MAEMERVEVRILDRPFLLRGAVPREELERLAAETDRRMREIAGRNPHLSALQVAVLAALNLAEELEEARRLNRRLQRALEEEWRRELRPLRDGAGEWEGPSSG
ncbi:MAG: cell division protein ZapA [Bacillota bacterium]|nr:cell division protein ZapA [Bacillota bacterium]